MKSNIAAAAILISLFLSGCATRPPLETIPSVDLKRYAGTWYEIAKFPNWFQRGCASDTRAEYSLNSDGSMKIVNSCRTKNGDSKTALGRATVVPGSNNTKLSVNFGGPIGGAYWIIGLDEKNYSWALVGHPSRKFLWILSREPRLSPATYRQIVELVGKRGYDVSKLELTPQSR